MGTLKVYVAPKDKSLSAAPLHTVLCLVPYCINLAYIFRPLEVSAFSVGDLEHAIIRFPFSGYNFVLLYKNSFIEKQNM